jgi:hypothetical protein
LWGGAAVGALCERLCPTVAGATSSRLFTQQPPCEWALLSREHDLDRASSRTSASASGRRRAERMMPADEDVLRAHVRVSQVCHVRPDAWSVGDRELMDELDGERIARSSRSPLDRLGERVAVVIRAARRRRAPALSVAIRLETPDGARRLPVLRSTDQMVWSNAAACQESALIQETCVMRPARSGQGCSRAPRPRASTVRST